MHRGRDRCWLLDRTQPGLPLKPGKCGTAIHDYKRNGTTMLFAALNILDVTVVGRCMPQHTHKEFTEFLNAVERSVPPGKIIHAIADNLRHPQASQGQSAARRSSAMGVPLHPNLRIPGSTPSKASSPPSPAGASAAASSSPLPTSSTPSAATSTSTTVLHGPSSGPNQPRQSSPKSAVCLYPPNESVQ